MALFIQHGHGKSDKIDTALSEGTASGVIFGARNEKPEKLGVYVEKLREGHDDAELFFDPQFYVSTLVPPNNRFLEEYPYYSQGLGAADFTGIRKIREYVKGTLEYQRELGFDALLSPSVIFDTFSDRWHQIALNLADVSLEYHAGMQNAPPLLLSFIFSEEALGGREDIDRFLDIVTQDSWNMEGFYLVVSRDEDGYQQRFDSSGLANFLYLVHVLSEINGLRVVCGYSDFVGIPLRAVGADVFASGWSQSLRRFQRKAFVKRKAGGQPPRVRYSSSKLVNSIFLTELQDIHDTGHLDEVLSRVELDEVINGASSPESAMGWNTATSQLHHWQTISAMDGDLSGNVRNDVRDTVRRLRSAHGLYTMLEAEGVQFDRQTGKEHLLQWVSGLAEFQRLAGHTRD